MMDYSRAIEKRDFAKIDSLNMLTNTKTFWDDVKRETKKVTSDHSLGRWQCLAEYRYKEISDIWDNFKKINEKNKIVFRCNEAFYGMYKGERNDMVAKYIEIYHKNEMFIVYNDKIPNRYGEIYYRINDANSFFFDGMVLEGSIIRAIDKGILEEVKDFKFPEAKIYNPEDILKIASN